MSGGHFILLKNIKDSTVLIINPIKDKHEEKNVEIDFIIKCCHNFGSWRLLIKE